MRRGLRRRDARNLGQLVGADQRSGPAVREFEQGGPFPDGSLLDGTHAPAARHAFSDLEAAATAYGSAASAPLPEATARGLGTSAPPPRPAGVCPAPAKAPAPRARRKCCQGVLSCLRGSGRSSLVRRSGCLPMRFRRVRDQDRRSPALRGDRSGASAGAGGFAHAGGRCSTQTPVLRREERSLEAAVVKQNDNAFGAGSAVPGLADVSPAVSAMERAALHVRLRSLPPGARCWAGRRRAHPDRRTNPTASRRKSSGCGGLVFGTLDLGSIDAVGQGRDRPPSPGAGPWLAGATWPSFRSGACPCTRRRTGRSRGR